MKSAKYIIYGLVLILASACANPTGGQTSSVTIAVKNYIVTESSGAKHEPTEYRLIGDFNGWGGGSTNKDAVWNGAIVMNFNKATNSFEATISAAKGSEIKYTFLSKYICLDTNLPSFYGWENPASLRFSSGEWIFSPFTRLEDNGMGNGGYNAVYLVP